MNERGECKRGLSSLVERGRGILLQAPKYAQQLKELAIHNFSTYKSRTDLLLGIGGVALLGTAVAISPPEVRTKLLIAIGAAAFGVVFGSLTYNWMKVEDDERNSI